MFASMKCVLTLGMPVVGLFIVYCMPWAEEIGGGLKTFFSLLAEVAKRNLPPPLESPMDY